MWQLPRGIHGWTGRHGPRGKLRRFIKRQTARHWRRLAKRDPAGAPVRRPTRGWDPRDNGRYR